MTQFVSCKLQFKLLMYTGCTYAMKKKLKKETVNFDQVQLIPKTALVTLSNFATLYKAA